MTSIAPIVTAPQVLTALLTALGAVVPFLILRNYEGLPEAWDNDVDILVRTSDLPAAREITLATLRRSPHASAARTLERLHFWSVSLPCSDRELQVDYYTAVSKAWVTYADTEVIFAARRTGHELFCVPDILHELLLIAAKELFAYGHIRPRYHARLAGHSGEEPLAAAMILFKDHLTDKGCRLVARALSDPTVTGRPGVALTALLRPCSILEWVRLRNNCFEEIV